MLMVLFTINFSSTATSYYVAISGDDNNSGTFEAPWGTWQKGFSTAQAGDTVYFRGGTWYPTDVVPATNSAVWHCPSFQPTVGHNGTANNRIYFFNYPGEIPVLDCSQLDTVGRRFNGAISLMGSHFLHLKGLVITNVYQPTGGELASGIGASWSSNLIFENLSVSNVGGRGMSYWGLAGNSSVPEIPFDTTMYINCDVYNCIDSLSEVPGNGSDGWKLDAEPDVYLLFYGCRAWNCGDDGFDVSGPGLTIFDHCWSFNHNYPSALEGNGFKFGGNRGRDAYIDSLGQLVLGVPVEGIRKIVNNCLAVNNIGVGYYDLGYYPYYPNNARIYNNVSYRNGIGISMAINELYSGQNPGVYKNNIIYATQQIDAAGRPYNLSVTEFYLESHNTWDYADTTIVGSLPWWQPTDTVTVTDDDFISIDESQLSWPRNADGSLPDIAFLTLAPTSDLIDAGVDVGFPYLGESPDIGYAEFDPQVVTVETHAKTDAFGISIFPNPAKDVVWVRSDEPGLYQIRILELSGRELLSKQLNLGAQDNYLLKLPSMKKGVYILEIRMGNKFKREKLFVH